MREQTAAINTEIKKFHVARDDDNGRISFSMYRTVHGTVCGLLEINYRNGRPCACASVKRQCSQPTGAPAHRGRLRRSTGAKTYYTGERSWWVTRSRGQLPCRPPETPPLCFSTLPRVPSWFPVFIVIMWHRVYYALVDDTRLPPGRGMKRVCVHFCGECVTENRRDSQGFVHAISKPTIHRKSSSKTRFDDRPFAIPIVKLFFDFI